MNPKDYIIKYELKEILNCLRTDTNSKMPLKENFSKSSKHYYEVLLEYAYILESFKFENKESQELWGRYAWTLFVYASWGFNFNTKNSLEYGFLLLKCKEKELREIGASIFTNLKKDSEFIDDFHKLLLKETENEVIDNMLMTIGKIKTKKSLPILKELLAKHIEDNDTFDLIKNTTSKITKIKFDFEENPKEKLIKWYEKNI